MTSLVEGVGDEVLVSMGILILVAILSLAWYSTRARPFASSGTVYVVQIEERNPMNRRVLQVVSMDENLLHNENQDINQVLNSVLPLADAGPNTVTSATTNQNHQSAADAIENTATEHGVPAQVVELTSHVSESSDEVESNNEETTGGVNNAAEEKRLIESKDEKSAIEHSNKMVQELMTSQNDSDFPSTPPRKLVKIKFLDETFKMATFELAETVGEFKRQNFQQETSQGQLVRLIFRGQVLKDDAKTLSSYGIQENSVVHCYLSTQSDQRPNSDAHADASSTSVRHNDGSVRGFSMGNYLYPIFGVNFCILWSVCFIFWQYVSVTAVVYLIFCTLTYAMFLYHHYRSSRYARHESSQDNNSSIAN